jgi:hypothetical protein
MNKCGPNVFERGFFKNTGNVVSPNSPYVFSNNGTKVLEVGTTHPYTTISLALAAATAGDTILVYPGTYTETLTIPVNNLTIIGVGKPNSVIIQQADANVINFNSKTGVQFKFFTVRVTAATTAIATVTGSTGSCALKECKTQMTTAADIAAASQPCVGEITGAGTLTLILGSFNYAHSGDGGVTAQKGAFKVGTGSTLTLRFLQDSTITTSGTELATSTCIDVASTGIVLLHDSNVTITATGTLVAGLAYLTGTGTAHEYYRNEIHIDATGCTNAYGFFAGDTASTSRFFFNHIHIENATKNYSFYLGAASTVISHFDDIVAADGTTGAGTYTYINSDTDGNLSVSGTTISDGLQIATSTPATAGAAGTAGTITWDADFVYTCVATNTWTRVATGTW